MNSAENNEKKSSNIGLLTGDDITTLAQALNIEARILLSAVFDIVANKKVPSGN